MVDQKTIVDPGQLAQLTDSLELARLTEQQAKNLCDLAEKFAQKYGNHLTKIHKAENE